MGSRNATRRHARAATHRGAVLPKRFWYAQGISRSMDLDEQVRAHAKHLVGNGLLEDVGIRSDVDPAASVTDVLWSNPDGSMVRARLWMETIERWSSNALIMLQQWSIAAECEGVWDHHWTSPAKLLLPQDAAPTTCGPLGLDFGKPLTLPPLYTTLEWDMLLGSSREEPWRTLVISHADQRAGHQVVQTPSDMLKVMPASAYGRLVQVNLERRDQFPALNGALRRLNLPEMPVGGILMVADQYRPASDCYVLPGHQREMFGMGMVRDAMGNRLEQQVALTPEVIKRINSFRTHPPFPPQPRAVAREPRSDQADVQRELDAARRRAEELDKELRAVRDEHARQAEEWQRRLDGDRLATIASLAIRDRDRARHELEAADAELDGLAREVTWLRHELAQTGRAYAEVVPEQDAPGSWQELIDRTTASLPFVMLSGDIAASTSALQGNPAEGLWIRRSWEALQMLNAYGQHQRSGQTMPRLSSYLDSPEATHVISRARIALRESEQVAENPRWWSARVFAVPDWVHESGRAYMGAHIRIGSTTPPAPRLHFLDDTHRQDGLGCVYVGYIGRHLPNSHTN